ncbi:MAG: hypothetical protein R6W70_08230 [bacterium]
MRMKKNLSLKLVFIISSFIFMFFSFQRMLVHNLGWNSAYTGATLFIGAVASGFFVFSVFKNIIKRRSSVVLMLPGIILITIFTDRFVSLTNNPFFNAYSYPFVFNILVFSSIFFISCGIAAVFQRELCSKKDFIIALPISFVLFFTIAIFFDGTSLFAVSTTLFLFSFFFIKLSARSFFLLLILIVASAGVFVFRNTEGSSETPMVEFEKTSGVRDSFRKISVKTDKHSTPNEKSSEKHTAFSINNTSLTPLINKNSPLADDTLAEDIVFNLKNDISKIVHLSSPCSSSWHSSKKHGVTSNTTILVSSIISEAADFCESPEGSEIVKTSFFHWVNKRKITADAVFISFIPLFSMPVTGGIYFPVTSDFTVENFTNFFKKLPENTYVLSRTPMIPDKRSQTSASIRYLRTITEGLNRSGINPLENTMLFSDAGYLHILIKKSGFSKEEKTSALSFMTKNFFRPIHIPDHEKDFIKDIYHFAIVDRDSEESFKFFEDYFYDTSAVSVEKSSFFSMFTINSILKSGNLILLLLDPLPVLFIMSFFVLILSGFLISVYLLTEHINIAEPKSIIAAITYAAIFAFLYVFLTERGFSAMGTTLLTEISIHCMLFLSMAFFMIRGDKLPRTDKMKTTVTAVIFSVLIFFLPSFAVFIPKTVIFALFVVSVLFFSYFISVIFSDITPVFKNRDKIFLFFVFLMALLFFINLALMTLISLGSMTLLIVLTVFMITGQGVFFLSRNIN